MKRNMDLVRELLLVTEEAETSFDPRDSKRLVDYTDELIVYHVELLCGHELIDASIQKEWSGKCVSCSITSLTWDGADYLDAIREPKIWKQTKMIVKEAVGSTTIGVIKEAAVMIAKKLIAKNLT